MKFPNWFRILWWVLLLIPLTLFLIQRYSDLVAGRAVSADIVVLLIWVGLALAPVFQEVHLFGFKLKQEVQEIHNKLDSLELKMDASATSQLNQQLFFQAPSPTTETKGGELTLKPEHQEVIRSYIKNLHAKKEATEKEKKDLKAQNALNQELAFGWKLQFLNLLLVPNSKNVLLWLYNNPAQSRDSFHTLWGPAIPAQTERDAILNILTTYGLVIETLAQLSVTQEGIAFLRYKGSLPPAPPGQ